MEFSGQRAWVTGASSGIGAATAKMLASAGAEVVLSARRKERLNSLVEEITATGGKALVKVVNVADKQAMTAVGQELDALGGVDVLINNAGVMPLSPMLEGRVDEWDSIIDVNIKGLLYAINAVLSGMAKRQSGHIVNLSSVGGRNTFPTGAVYSGSKFAVRAISDTLRKEAIHYGVRVTDIQPGGVNTELVNSIKYTPVHQAMTSKGGFYGQDTENLQSEDIANAIFYALSQPKHVDVSEILIRPRTQEI